MYENMKYSICLMFPLKIKNFHYSHVPVSATKLSQVQKSNLIFFAFLYPYN